MNQGTLILATTAFLGAFSILCAQQTDESPFDLRCFPLNEKPKTQISVSPADAAEFWLRTVPANLIWLPNVTNDRRGGKVYPDSIRDEDVPKGLTRDGYISALVALHEFKRTHAHEFWKPHAGSQVTVEGFHYCPCCFYAGIGKRGKGWNGLAVRLDMYVAIGLPEGTRCYTPNGESVPRKTLPSLPSGPTIKAVGTVTGPHPITNDLQLGVGDQAVAYYVLSQSGKRSIQPQRRPNRSQSRGRSR